MTLKHKKIQHKVTKPTTFCDWIKILAPLTLFGSLHHYCRPSNMLGSWTEYLVEFYVLLGWIHDEYSIIQQRVHITKWRTYFKTFSRIHSSTVVPQWRIHAGSLAILGDLKPGNGHFNPLCACSGVWIPLSTGQRQQGIQKDSKVEKGIKWQMEFKPETNEMCLVAGHAVTADESGE